MTDSLDDFFAKKDKKRGKDKTKVSALSAEALVRELEEGSKQNDYPVRKDIKTTTAIEILGLDSNDADWKDFEEVEKRDYTGLKVKEMSLQDQTDDEQRRLNEQTEQVPESTPWKIKEETSSAINADSSSLSAASVATVAKQKQEADDKLTTPSDANNKTESSSENKEDDNKLGEQTNAAGEQASNTTDASKKDGDNKNPSAKKAAYVPPHERNAAASGEVKFLEPMKLSKGKTTRQSANLNFQDEKAFPSLG